MGSAWVLTGVQGLQVVIGQGTLPLGKISAPPFCPSASPPPFPFLYVCVCVEGSGGQVQSQPHIRGR